MKYQVTKIITTILMAVLFSGTVFATETKVADDLIEAVQTIDLVSLNVLLSEGAAIDTVDTEGNTPLMLASRIGNPRMLRIILVHNPDIHVRNNNGETALMIAAENGQLSVVEQLLSKGADMHGKNNAGLTPLDLATRFGHRQVINMLKNPEGDIISR